MNFDLLYQNITDHAMEPVETAPSVSSAVLIPIIQQNGEPHILFKVRTSHIRQGGEICFPGGRVEDSETPEEAAVWETCEELCVQRDSIRIIAPMFSTSRGDLQILSYLGEIKEYHNTWSTDEVERTFLLPLSWLLEHDPLTAHGKLKVSLDESFPYHLIPRGRDYPFASASREYYFYQTEHGVIWGLTASILQKSIALFKHCYSL